MLTIIGDTHGKFDEYYKIASNTGFSVQIGDFGFSSAWNKLNYSDLDPNRHKVCTGNHCDYDMAPNSPFYLGDYGMTNVGGLDFFFVRGGISIDRVYRVGEELGGSPKTWWSQEELNFYEMTRCLDLYKKLKPDVVLSHVPPSIFIDKIHGNKGNSILQRYKFHEGFRENTSALGTMMLNSHIPKLWISGHHHKSFQEESGDFKFVSLAELETYEINL